jgi:flavin reductase (DIM6/NTAB) family NADH-FMN oxidoreductase RutF
MTTTERIDAGAYRRIFRRYPAGVVAITLDAGRGPAGFTATSLTSLSADPPLVSFSISQGASSWPHVRDASTFVVNFLGAHQESVAARFATSGVDRFAKPTKWTRLADGEPVLSDTAGWLRARVRELVSAGDHVIVIAEVLQDALVDGHSPLVYHDGRYLSLPHPREVEKS